MNVDECTPKYKDKRERDKQRKRQQRAHLNERLKFKVKNYDRKKAARYRLEIKGSQDKIRTQQATRQSRYRLRKKIPSTPLKFKVVVQNVLKVGFSSPRKEKILKSSLGQLQSKVRSAESEECKRNPILRLKALKDQNRNKDQADLVQQFVLHFGSLRKAAEHYGIRWATFLDMCRPKKQRLLPRQLLAKQNSDTIEEFFNLYDVSTSMPTSKHANKRFMMRTLEDSYPIYVKWCRENKKKPMSSRTFARCRPGNVRCIANTPDAECLCEKCRNFTLLKVVLLRCKVVGIKKSTLEAVKETICPVEATDVHVDPDLGYLHCIRRKCQKCGTQKYLDRLLDLNPSLEGDNEVVEWRRWDNVIVGKRKKMDIVFMHGTKLELLNLYIEDLKAMAEHQFHRFWQYGQFRMIQTNLPSDVLLQVMDFGQNYLNKYQNEPQSVHWHHQQTTLHPIVNYYQTEDGLVTEEHMHISCDINHDKFAVEQFQKKTLNYFKSSHFTPKMIIQFCDNCSAQYKSKGPFHLLSLSNIPVIRCYFGARHGKGPADGAIGRAKRALVVAVKSGVILRNALEVHEFLVSHYQKMAEKRKECKRFLQKSFYSAEINRQGRMSVATISGTQKFHSIRSTGNKGVIQSRSVTCLCRSCLHIEDTQCPNSHYVAEWRSFKVSTGSEIKGDLSSNHWLVPHEENEVNLDETIEGVDRNEDVDQLPSYQLPYIPFEVEVATNRFHDMYEMVQQCKTFHSLRRMISRIVHPTMLVPISNPVVRAERGDRIDEVAISELPDDAPPDCVPIETAGDGNCCPRAFSKAVYGTGNYHKEIRMRMLMEGVLNRNRYFDNEYLKIGAEKEYGHATLPLVYAQYISDFRAFQLPPNISGKTRLRRLKKLATDIYEKDMVKQRISGTYMSMWQLFQAANVLGRPVRIVFPKRGSEDFRKDFNRSCFPWDPGLRDKPPVTIMWTPVAYGGEVNHFVPMLSL